MSYRFSSPVGQYQSPSQLKQARHSESALPVAGAADQGAEVNPGEIAGIDLNCQLCADLGHQLLCRLWSCTRQQSLQRNRDTNLTSLDEYTC